MSTSGSPSQSISATEGAHDTERLAANLIAMLQSNQVGSETTSSQVVAQVMELLTRKAPGAGPSSSLPSAASQHHLSSSPSMTRIPPSRPDHFVPTSAPSILPLSPSIPSPDDPHVALHAESGVEELLHRLTDLEQAHRDASISTRRRRRPTRLTDDDEEPYSKHQCGTHLVSRLQRDRLDEMDLPVRAYLQKEVRKTMYNLIGYQRGALMPDISGPLVARSGLFLVPDFKAGINAPPNRLIQGREAEMVLAYERDHPGTVPETHRERWLQAGVLLDLARASWPAMKLMHTEQRLAELDGGEKKMRREREARRIERRKTVSATPFHMELNSRTDPQRGQQPRDAIVDFCQEHDLDHQEMRNALVDEEWLERSGPVMRTGRETRAGGKSSSRQVQSP
ncbi:hypothetical protein DACRYDRAFT_108199 [Dacryopinax primogenitus]|uniref:Uncharacterized protein n=1 Tax=Dacryopinax primogenitus (strain DJM 731) TaxID=1858805 RepID=M5FV67_DACPD|nr:uncharacterized protein DACRYDRAFT_108199 [Dacryopinax primogenitus]EJU01671.1 hypothetical protein DACRYDRAFT_108199 [Dacryopinax primogenitus]